MRERDIADVGTSKNCCIVKTKMQLVLGNHSHSKVRANTLKLFAHWCGSGLLSWFNAG